MDLGISGKKAIICASSRGLGKACAESLASEGVEIFINGIQKENLTKTTKEDDNAAIKLMQEKWKMMEEQLAVQKEQLAELHRKL